MSIRAMDNLYGFSDILDFSLNIFFLHIHVQVIVCELPLRILIRLILTHSYLHRYPLCLTMSASIGFILGIVGTRDKEMVI